VFPFTYGGPPLPDGPVVIAANHFSHLDPVVISAAAGRQIRFLAVDELFGNSRVFDRLTTWLGAIPMTRTGVPLGALKLALAEMVSGGSIGVFPEGERVWAWGEKAPKRGAAWLARRAGVSLVPVAVSGTDRSFGRGASWISRAPIHVEMCRPIHPAAHADADDPVTSMTTEWERRITEALALS
jgi:1-acyl-sn-glycerol-3-phosphate acyltransferase